MPSLLYALSTAQHDNEDSGSGAFVGTRPVLQAQGVCYILLLTSSHPRPARLPPRSCAEPSISTPSPAGYSQAKCDVLQLLPAAAARSDRERSVHVVHSGGCFPAIRGGPLPFGWRYAQQCSVLEMHAIFTSEPGAGRCAHYITRRGAAAPSYVLEYMYCMCINSIH
jgi:hypothetical protein